MQPPVAPTRPHVHTDHGVERPDPWHWLKDREDPATLAYIEAENAYTSEALAPLEPLREALYAEMLGRIQETWTSVKVPDGPWRYYTRTVEGQAYTIHCREPLEGGEETVLLDENALAAGFDFFSLGDLETSPDHTRIAYTFDTTGDEIHTLVVLDIATGEELDRVHGVSASFTWGNDSNTIYWHEIDSTQRPWRVRARSVPGGEATDDPILYEDPDGRFYVWIRRTRPGRFLVVNSASSETSERWLLDGDDPGAGLRCVHPRTEGLIYKVEVDHEGVWITTNDGDDPDRRTPELRIYRAPLETTARADWTLWQETRRDVSLEGVHAFRDFVVVEERRDGNIHVVVHERTTGVQSEVAMAETSYVAGMARSPVYDGRWFHYTYSSMVAPRSIYRFDVDSGSSTLLEQTPVPGYDPAAFSSARIHATADDGTDVPISLVWKGGPDIPQDAPCMLYGYGSYGITIEPVFRTVWTSLTERGVVVAIAHVRGGGYHGRRWYEAAKFLTKMATFDDFIAAGRHLVQAGITRPGKLGIMGGSAGGMLVGAVMNRAPDLCTAVVAAVPFVDVVSTMLDASLPLTTGEYHEWGDPNDRLYFDAMLAYSPYDNVAAVDYPDLLVISGLNDPRVQYWEPTKWVAKLRATATGGEVLLKTHMGAGHQGQSGRYGFLQDKAEELAWLVSKIAPAG
ncbi:MAG: S9 family peptidase [Myxococcales bacterium]|nr:S9 family peptidase [Myxococcales bacterium]